MFIYFISCANIFLFIYFLQVRGGYSVTADIDTEYLLVGVGSFTHFLSFIQLCSVENLCHLFWWNVTFIEFNKINEAQRSHVLFYVVMLEAFKHHYTDLLKCRGFSIFLFLVYFLFLLYFLFLVYFLYYFVFYYILYSIIFCIVSTSNNAFI